MNSWGSNIGSTEGVISIGGVHEPEQIRSIDGIAIPKPTILPAGLGIDPRPASPQITLTTSPDIRSQPAILSNWSGEGQHVEYERDTDIPLRPVRHLGRGSSGDVYEVTCEGVALARKLIYPSKTAKREDIWNEVDIMQKLRHRHIVRLVGSYIQNRVLGILLWPVAVCDLAVFLDGLDGDDWAREYIKNLGLSYSPHDSENFRDPRLFLRRLYGCLANTMEYLHGNKVRHKDIKPNNILLTEDGVFLTDFGISRDLTDLSQSITDGPLRGTYKYCAPEVARYAERGRAADIYSLGCIFLEMSTVLYGFRRDVLLEDQGVAERKSFQSSPQQVSSWIERLSQGSRVPGRGVSPKFFEVLSAMLSEDPRYRPTAEVLARRLYELGGSPSSLHARCCEIAP